MNRLISTLVRQAGQHARNRTQAPVPCQTAGSSVAMRKTRLAWRHAQKAVLSCVLVLASAGSAPAAAQTGVPGPDAPEAAFAQEHAEVRLDGETLFRVRGLTAYPADQRASDIAGRISAIAADPAIKPESLRVVEQEDRSTILAGERMVMNVIDADAALEGVRRQILAEAYLKRIAAAITAYRHGRSPEVLLRHALYAAGATLAVVMLLFAIHLVSRWLDAAASRRLGRRIEAVEKESIQLIRTSQLWNALHRLIKTLRALLALVVLYVYLEFVLGLYPWTKPASRGLFDLVMEPLRVMGAALISKIPDLVFLAILVAVTHYVLKFAKLFFAGIEHGRIQVAGIDSELAPPTYKIVRLLIIILALVVAYPYIPGSESDAFKGISIFIGVIFSLGSTSVIGNVVAGYAMIYRRAFRIGDRIQVGDHIGDVLERRILVTRLRSLKNEELVIPNSEILNSTIVNYSTLAKDHGLILHTTVGIGYEMPWRQVEAMLRMAAGRTPGLLAAPEPFVLQMALGDFAVTYELNAYCDQPQAMRTLYTALHQNILDVFNEYGVQIMTPAYEGDAEKPKVVPKARWFEAPAKHPAGSQNTRDGNGPAA